MAALEVEAHGDVEQEGRGFLQPIIEHGRAGSGRGRDACGDRHDRGDREGFEGRQEHQAPRAHGGQRVRPSHHRGGGGRHAADGTVADGDQECLVRDGGMAHYAVGRLVDRDAVQIEALAKTGTTSMPGGGLLGLVVAYLVRSEVFGISTLDPLTFALVILLLGGSALIARSATGFCPVYAATGINTVDDRSDTRMALGGSRGVGLDPGGR